MANTIDLDVELVEALRHGEATAVERLVATFSDRVYRLAIGITRSQQDAEEAVQDAFWSVVRNIDTFRGDAALGSWIYRITANAASQRLRSGARRRGDISLNEMLPVDPSVDWSTELDDPAVQTELRSVLTSALDELPDHYRTVIILHDVEGLSLAKVADRLDISVPTAKARAHRARRALRKRLGMFWSDPSSGVDLVS